MSNIESNFRPWAKIQGFRVFLSGLFLYFLYSPKSLLEKPDKRRLNSTTEYLFKTFALFVSILIQKGKNICLPCLDILIDEIIVLNIFYQFYQLELNPEVES